jgi:small subunit ribosomal protein S5
MAESLGEGSLESTTLSVGRTSATVKGGRRFSFGALVVVGDRRGRVGFGYGKSKEVPLAVEKAQKYAKRAMKAVPLAGSTIPHEVEGSYSSAKVRLIPASPGTGVVAGGTVRAILEMAGIHDCLTKCYGSTNARNMVKAVFDGIERLRTREQIAAVRGVEITSSEIENKIERGRRFMPVSSGKEKMRGPVNTVNQERRGRGGGGGGRGRGGGRGGPGASAGGGQQQGGPTPGGGAPSEAKPA